MYTFSFHSSLRHKIYFDVRIPEGIVHRSTPDIDRDALEKGKVWAQKRLSNNPEIQEGVIGILEEVKKNLMSSHKSPEDFEQMLSNYIENTGNTLDGLQNELNELVGLKNPQNSDVQIHQKIAILQNTLNETKIAYTQGLIELTRLHAKESGNSDLARAIEKLASDLAVAKSQIIADTGNNTAFLKEEVVKVA